MASNPRTPPRPDRRGPTPSATPAQPNPGPSAAVLEIELTHPIKVGLSGELTTRIVFARPPGLGEVDGWLDETDPVKMAQSLEVLPFRPGWQIHVLSQCAKVSPEQARQISVADMLTIGAALVPFVSGSQATGESAPSSSPGSSAGGRETSES